MIKAQQILELLNDPLFVEDNTMMGRLAGISEERLRTAEVISYDFYDRAITYLLSEEFSNFGLKYLVEDYIGQWGYQGVEENPDPRQGDRPNRPDRYDRREEPRSRPDDTNRSDDIERRRREQRARGVSPAEVQDVSKSNTRLGQLFYDIFLELGDTFTYLVNELGMGLQEILNVFRQKTLYSLLRAFAFSIKAMVMCMGRLAVAVKRGLFRTLKELYETGFVNDLKNGLTTIDKVISEKPILKLLGGPTMAGFLLMAKLTDLIAEEEKYARAVTAETIARALGGQYSIGDFLASPSAMLISSLALIGLGSYISVHWLAGGTYAIATVLLIIGLKLIGKKPPTPVARNVQYGPD